MSDKEKALIAALNGSQVASTGASLSEASSELDAHLDAHLDEVFATARQTRPEVPVSLQAAILADAALLQKARVEVLTCQTAGQASGQITGQITGQLRARQSAALRLWRQFAAAVGGWPALGGMAAASLAGLWIGLAPPSFLPDPVERYAAFSTGSQLMTDLGYDVSLLMGDEVFE